MTSSTSSPTSRHDQLLSPPLSPFLELELPVLVTDEFGMIADDEETPKKTRRRSKAVAPKGRKPVKRNRITYISRHFTNQGSVESEGEVDAHDGEEPSRAIPRTMARKGARRKKHDLDPATPTPPMTPDSVPPIQPRVYYGINIDDFSSDSSLTDVPDDIGEDPFQAFSSDIQVVKLNSQRKARRPTKSPYFPHPHRHRTTFLSMLPFPPLTHDRFGLMQERLAHDPFRLLIATIFLNKTPGERAMPIFYQLMSKYPTPADLAVAEVSEITSMIYGLGFQNQRARKCVSMAQAWLERPPERGKRYRKLNYPVKGDGRDVKEDEILDDSDTRVAWEISHLPGLGPYSHDSWRMFCRDTLRGVAKGWNGEDANTTNSSFTNTSNAKAASFEPEWKRVLPLDKELRAWLTWMWMKEGWVWNKETGQRTRASDELMDMARGGGIVIEEREKEHLVVKQVDESRVDALKDREKIGKAAGDFLPDRDENIDGEQVAQENNDVGNAGVIDALNGAYGDWIGANI